MTEKKKTDPPVEHAGEQAHTGQGQSMAAPDGPQIYARLVGILAEVDAIPKNQRNAQQGFNFRGVDDAVNALHDVFARWEVIPLPCVLDTHTEVRQGRNGPLNYVFLKVRYTFVTVDGSSASATTVGESLDAGDKAATKAMSNALKYALFQTFQIPTNEPESDHESNQAVPADAWESATPARPQQAAQQQPAPQQPAQQVPPAQASHANAADLGALKAQLDGCKTPADAKSYQKKIRDMFKANTIAPDDANKAMEMVAARVKELEAA